MASHIALSELVEGSTAIVGELRLAKPVADHLMNLGFVPGIEVTVCRSSPGGGPRIYRVDGAEVAMRRDVSQRIVVHSLTDKRPRD